MGNILRVSALAGALAAAAMTVSAQQKISREEYIDRYKTVAIEHMDVYGIPASIKMAQALLESDNGNSRLATEANNHFGIKCKSTWQGLTITHDDDALGECFRKYLNVEESFADHSEFLDKSPRYDFLFKLSPTDYKGWAYGLKQAGYATLPTYAERLIKIIEDNKLYLLDEGRSPVMASTSGGATPAKSTTMAVSSASSSQSAASSASPAHKSHTSGAPATTTGSAVDVDNYVIALYENAGNRVVYSNNCCMFVRAAKGDSFGSIASDFGLKENKLLAFNDLAGGSALSEGDMVYITRKSRRSENGTLMHQVEDGETMRCIAQRYGIKLKSLCTLNRCTADAKMTTGQHVRLM